MAKRRANGEGSLYQRKDGTWTAQYTDCNGKKRYLYGKTQQIVKEKLKEAIKQSDTGLIVNTRKISLSDWVLEWLEVYHRPIIRESLYGHSFRVWRTHIKPYFEKVQLKDARAEQLQKFFNEKGINRLDGKSGGYSTSTCAQIKNMIAGALKKAVELGYIVKNPAEHIKLPAVVHKEKKILTVEQQRKFEAQVYLDMVSYCNSSAFILLLYTGMRVGEAMGLRIEDIDFEKSEIHIRRTVGFSEQAGGGIKFYVNPPKTKAGKRTIPMSAIVIKILSDQIERRNELVNQLHEQWEKTGRDLSVVDAGYIFMTSRGCVVYSANLNIKLNSLLDKAGISPYVSLHGLRHTFATRWLEAGLDVRSLAEILGHSDVKMTLNIYPCIA